MLSSPPVELTDVVPPPLGKPVGGLDADAHPLPLGQDRVELHGPGHQPAHVGGLHHEVAFPLQGVHGFRAGRGRAGSS